MFINGTYETLYIKDDDGLWLPIACITSNSFSEVSETIDTTTRDNVGWKTFLPTNQEYNISFDGLETEDVVIAGKTTLYSLRERKHDRDLIEWRIGKDNYLTGKGYITELSSDYGIDEFVSFSGTIKGYGKYTYLIESIYDDYESRVISAGGTVASESCTLSILEDMI